MLKKVLWIIACLLALLIGFFPLYFLATGLKFGIEEIKSPELYQNYLWKTSFYTHIPTGSIAILVGWTQFSKKLRARYLNVHRLLGKIYVGSFLICSAAGFIIAFYASGGIVPAIGFGLIACIAFSVTLKAYLDIRKGDVIGHQKMMIFSYASCFSAVTFRIWSPICAINISDFDTAYSIAAWMAWIPNLVVAYFLARSIGTSPLQALESQ